MTLHLQPLDKFKPVLVTDGPDVAGDGYLHLLMPVRLDGLK